MKQPGPPPAEPNATIPPGCLDIVEVILLMLDGRGEVTYINRKGCELLGLPREEIVGKNWFDGFLPASGRAEIKAVFHSLMRGEVEPAEYFENPIRLPGGEERLIAWHNALIYGEKGRIRGVISSGEDVTERRADEERLRDQERRLRTIVETMVDGLIVVDERGRIESANRSAEKMFGYPPGGLAGINLSLLMPAPFSSEHDAYLQRYLETGEARIIGTGREVEGKRKDGSVFPMSLAVNEMRMGEARLFVGNIRDLTEERRMREQLHQGEKFSSLGELVAGIAHEIGGALSVISGNAQFMNESMEMNDARKADVEGIIRECDAVAALLRRLLNFSRPTKPELRPVDVNESVRNVFFLTRKQVAKENIEVKLDLQVGLPEVLGDPNQLEQVFMNLVLNAWHAMPRGGTLVIRSFRRGEEAGEGPPRVCVELSDTGVGIEEADLPRIFEPYFSKRKKGKGTGLGLPLSRRIIDEHGGAIGVESRPDHGTTFTVELPVAPVEASG